MRVVDRFLAPALLAASLLGAGCEGFAAEGTTAAGPIGGTDIRSAVLPPPGLYGGVVRLYSHGPQAGVGPGHPVPGVHARHLFARVARSVPVLPPAREAAGGAGA